MKAQIDMAVLNERFRSDDNCREYLEGLRWPDGVRCLRCESDRISRIDTRKLYQCMSCGHQFSVTAGTIFHDTRLPLWKWFSAVYLIGESKKGISSNQLKRMLGVSYKTAWYLSHRIRAAMKDEAAPLLSGIVEVDEAYIGGKRKGVGQGSKKHRTMVLGAVARGGEVRLKVDKRNDRKTLHGFIRSVVADDAEAIMTDDWHPYKGIGDANTRHEIINHTQEEWVRGQVHTNTVEGVWSLLKRSVVGSYHQLSAKHLQAYADEMAFRYNNRQNPFLFRDAMLRLIRSGNLPYQALIAN
ncbi:MAG: IS1595 family transposase [Dehalococcoidia bacterium]